MEKWKNIFGFDGRYQISNLGRVKSLARERIVGSNGARYISKEKILSPVESSGYLVVRLYKDGNWKKRRIHRLVAETFLGVSDLTVNHKNGNKKDNCVENLEWVTHQENMAHARKYLIDISRNSGEGCYKAKLKTKEVLFIRRSKKKDSVLAKKFGVSRASIWNIRNWKCWKCT